MATYENIAYCKLIKRAHELNKFSPMWIFLIIKYFFGINASIFQDQEWH